MHALILLNQLPPILRQIHCKIERRKETLISNRIRNWPKHPEKLHIITLRAGSPL